MLYKKYLWNRPLHGISAEPFIPICSTTTLDPLFFLSCHSQCNSVHFNYYCSHLNVLQKQLFEPRHYYSPPCSLDMIILSPLQLCPRHYFWCCSISHFLCISRWWCDCDSTLFHFCLCDIAVQNRTRAIVLSLLFVVRVHWLNPAHLIRVPPPLERIDCETQYRMHTRSQNQNQFQLRLLLLLLKSLFL